MFGIMRFSFQSYDSNLKELFFSNFKKTLKGSKNSLRIFIVFFRVNTPWKVQIRKKEKLNFILVIITILFIKKWNNVSNTATFSTCSTVFFLQNTVFFPNFTPQTEKKNFIIFVQLKADND